MTPSSERETGHATGIDREAMGARGLIEPDMVRRSSSRVVFLDAQHVTWEVTERDGRTCPGTRGPRCLLFDSGDVIRRVWEYPESWRSLSAEGLSVLSWRR